MKFVAKSLFIVVAKSALVAVFRKCTNLYALWVEYYSQCSTKSFYVFQ